MLSCAAGRAGAETYTYQGQLQIQNVPGDPCAITSSEGGYSIAIYGRDDSFMQRIDGYLEGEKIVRAHVTGNDIGQLGVTYPGEGSPSHVMRLRQLGDGSFVGTFETKTMVAALSGCGFTNASIAEPEPIAAPIVDQAHIESPVAHQQRRPALQPRLRVGRVRH